MKQNELNELAKKEVNIQFAFACLNGDIETIRENLNNEYIDNLGYEKGMFGVYAAMNGHKEILNLLYQDARSEEIKQYQHSIFNAAASYGKTECVEFLLKHGADPIELKGTTAYNNYHDVEVMFDQYIKEHPTQHLGETHSIIDEIS